LVKLSLSLTKGFGSSVIKDIQVSEPSSEATVSGGISPEILEQIRQAVLFRGMPRDELADLFSSAKVDLRERGEILFRPGDQADRFYFLLDGRIDLYVESSKHKESTIDLVGAGKLSGLHRFSIAASSCTGRRWSNLHGLSWFRRNLSFLI